MKDKSSFIKIIKTSVKILLLINLVIFIYSYFKKDTLPQPSEILSSLYQEPGQTEIEIESFSLEKEGFTYNITPKYAYELYGLIVSDYDSENPFDLSHEKDPLNTKDLCVIWGDNSMNGVYQEMKFGHGEWTCYFEFRSGVGSEWYSKFNDSQGSNNHLLPKDDNIYNEIKKSAVGDQIHFKGYLVDYSIKTPEGETGTRKTSTVREDSGCEIVYVTEFEISKEGNHLFRLLFNISKYAITVCLIILILLFFLT